MGPRCTSETCASVVVSVMAVLRSGDDPRAPVARAEPSPCSRMVNVRAAERDVV